MSFRQVYPELSQIIEHGTIEYGCDICKALSFASLEESLQHCRAENKGKPRASQWRHEPTIKQLPLSGQVNIPVRYVPMQIPIVDPRELDAD